MNRTQQWYALVALLGLLIAVASWMALALAIPGAGAGLHVLLAALTGGAVFLTGVREAHGANLAPRARPHLERARAGVERQVAQVRERPQARMAAEQATRPQPGRTADPRGGPLPAATPAPWLPARIAQQKRPLAEEISEAVTGLSEIHYRNLLARAKGDHALVEHLVALERERRPGASRANLLRNALQHWERDHR